MEAWLQQLLLNADSNNDFQLIELISCAWYSSKAAVLQSSKHIEMIVQ